MAKLTTKRKTRSDKFPLTLHKTGQFCKKIRGRLYYFGNDKQVAMKRYLEQAAYLHAGKNEPKSYNSNFPIKTLCNLYLQHQESRLAVGEIKPRQICDQTILLKDFAKYLGSHRHVSEVTTIDLQNYRQRLIRSGKCPNTINKYISAIKAMYNWATENEITKDIPNLKAVKKITRPKNEKPTFTIEQIKKLIKNADLQMSAMILLGLNCGFGCTDCAELKWNNLDLEQSRVIFPRGKTGISRNLWLWPETVETLKKLPHSGELVFYTSFGNPWVRVVKQKDEKGNEKYLKDDAISKKFCKLLREVGIALGKGVGFYTLRRTAATLAAKSGDPFAVQTLLGHADLKMASVYVQDVSEQTDRAINNSRKLLFQENEPEKS
jgi:integrase